jgi:RNA polymerase sigma-70 factor (ECF subfamily)
VLPAYLKADIPASRLMVEHNPADIDLLKQLRGSNREAFQTLFERYQPMLFRQALFLTGQADLSHDIVQETFVRVWEQRKTLKPHLSFPGFILRISQNLVRDHARQRKTHQKLEIFIPSPSSSEGDNPAEAFELTELEQRLRWIMQNQLSERCRQVFILNRFEAKSYREIATLLHLSVRTVEHHIGHALATLRKNLKDESK